MKEVTMEYEISLLTAGAVIHTMQAGMNMVMNHDDKNILRITGYVECLRNMGLLDEKISSEKPDVDVILVDKDSMLRTLVEYIENQGGEWAEGYKLCLHYLGIIK